MQLNKYDLVEYLSSLFDYINCSYCPIRKECDERKEKIICADEEIICADEEKIRKTLIEKYNL